MKTLVTVLVAVCVLGFAVYAGVSAPKVLQIKGSDTMVNLGQAWAEVFMARYKIPVAVIGGGSGTGIAALINGKTDVCQASRPMKEEEIHQARQNGVSPVAHIVGYDGISVVVSPKNPVKQLTMKQLGEIYLGKITNWKDVGGSDGKIVLLGRELNSGTHVFFKEHVIQSIDKKGEYAKAMLMLPSNQAIHDEAAGNVNAIGYIGMGYVTPKVKTLPISSDGKTYVAPSVKAVMNKTYPVARPLYWYTNGKPSGTVKKFVDFAKSAEGQKIVQKLDFVPIK
jgi:phosphate transport system substrate-binding protein